MMMGFLWVVTRFTTAKRRMNGPVIRAQLILSGYTPVRNFNKFRRNKKMLGSNIW
jgi:hypothetical protein